MASSHITRALLALTAVNASMTATLLYNNYQKLERNHEEAEARMDELEGTLRGHIGLIEEALERIEGNQGAPKGQQSMGKKAEELYGGRGKTGRRNFDSATI